MPRAADVVLTGIRAGFAVLLTAAFVLGGCFSPDIGECEIACGAGRACPDDMVCGTDGLCRSELGVRCGPLMSGPDAKLSGGPDAALSEPDAALSEPDAAVSEPDAPVVATPDAAVSEPDAPVVGGPDAAVSEPDAAPPPCTGDIVTIDDFGDVGRKVLDVRLGIAPDGHKHITYVTGDADPRILVHSDQAPGEDAWHTQELYDTYDLLIGQQVDSSGGVHVSYIQSGSMSLSYARRSPEGVWSTRVVRNGPNNWNSSIVVDGGGIINVLVHTLTSFTQARGTPDSSIWQMTSVDAGYQSGQGSEAVLTPDGTLATVYRRAKETSSMASDLRLAVQGVDGWGVTPLDTTGDTGHYPAMAVEANGDLHVVYGDFSAKVLRYMFIPRDGAPVSRIVVDDGSELGRYNSVAVDHEGNLHITSLDLTAGRLRHAVQRPEARAFTLSTVEVTGRIEGRSSIAVAPDGGVWVAFPNAQTGHARLARLCP